MKKSVFKVLCMVLIIALLAPNAFAATPTPEVPLVDAATVARVKQEVADGEITDMEDLFLVAYQHLGADLEEEGMTAYINEDGTLGITQILSSEKKMTRSSGEVEEYAFATTTIALVDNEGRAVTEYEYYTPSSSIDSDALTSINVMASHTAYYSGRRPVDPYSVEPWKIRLDYMVTTISCAGSTTYVNKIKQVYEHRFMYSWDADEADSKTTTNNMVQGSYSFTPATRSWYDEGSGAAVIVTQAYVYVAGVTDPIVLETVNSLAYVG